MTRRAWPLGSVGARVSLACSAVAVAVVVVLAVLVTTVLSRREYAALDRRLAVVSQSLAAAVAEDFPDGLGDSMGNPRARAVLWALAPGLIATVGQNGRTIGTASAPGSAASAPSELPVSAPGQQTVEVEGTSYRLLTVELDGTPGLTLSVGLPAELAEAPVRAIRLWGIAIGSLAALLGAGLGWAVARVAVRPLRQLRDRTRAIDGHGPMPTRAELTAGAPGSAAETEQLADAIAGLLQRVQTARHATETALQNAQDFAAAADHELRTPLTTIQTDLDVLLAHPDLDAGQRREILAEITGAKSRMVDTLQALRSLADGDVATGGLGAYATAVDVGDLTRRVVSAARPGDGVQLTVVVPDEETAMIGSPGGLRLAIENLLSNALRHGRAGRVEVCVLREGARIVERVDDDGSGLPLAERDRVFARFARGSQAIGAGSGLGLALVAQQAALHGGHARLSDNSWGGLRAELELPAEPAAASTSG